MPRRELPRRKQIARPEREVGRRLREFREGLRLTQREFAGQVGITRERLASYEDFRAALRFDLGLRICRQFIISEKWLATGEGGMRHLMDLASEPIARRVALGTPFAEAYHLDLGKRYEELAASAPGPIRIVPVVGDDLSYFGNLFDVMLERWCSQISPEALPLFLKHLITLGDRIVAVYQEHGEMPELFHFDPRKVGNK